MIKYSIIIPVYNLENYIEKTIDSLKGAGEDTEIIFVDDGSKDNSYVFLDSYIMNSNARNMKVIRQFNQGVSAARNRGIAEASGEYLIFVDGDDILSLNCLKAIRDKNSDIIVWRFETDKEGTRTISQNQFPKSRYSAEGFMESLMSGTNRIRIGSFAVKRELINRCGLKFTEGCAICEDVEFMYKMVLCASEVCAVNITGYTYVIREGSASNTYDMKRFQAPKAIERVYEYAGSMPGRKFNEYIMDSLKYGMFITHAMYSFDACARYIKSSKARKEFLNYYFSNYGDLETKIKEAKKNMKYKPEIYSKKRLSLFLMSRKMYTKRVCKQNGKKNGKR